MPRLLSALAGAALSIAVAVPASARDNARPAPATQTTPAYAIPNPYAAPPHVRASGDAAADAYAMGFAIGLGTALINKQREDELRQKATPR